VLAGILTLFALAAFLGGVAWAYSGKRKKEFDDAARMPLDDDDEPTDRGNRT
jgi:cytochrome c oxidase cbb3-type subunit 4